MATTVGEVTIKIRPEMTEEARNILRQIILEELAKILAEAGETQLVQQILAMIANTQTEMERVSEQRALDMQSDLIDTIEQLCKEHMKG